MTLAIWLWPVKKQAENTETLAKAAIDQVKELRANVEVARGATETAIQSFKFTREVIKRPFATFSQIIPMDFGEEKFQTLSRNLEIMAGLPLIRWWLILRSDSRPICSEKQFNLMLTELDLWEVSQRRRSGRAMLV